MKTRLALLVAALQVLLLAFMAGQREWISRNGQPILLRTAPIDPDDPMRGAYVHLNYEINTVPAALCRGAPKEWLRLDVSDYAGKQALRDRVVYAALKVNPRGMAELASLSDQPPASGTFLRGRVESVEAGAVRVRYGLEALFLPKVAAQKMEAALRGEKAGAAIDAHVAVGSSGIAVLKGYAWEPLGLTLAFDRPPPRATPPSPGHWAPQLVAGLTATLHNYSDRDVAIVDLPGGGAFRLVPANARFRETAYAWADPAETPAVTSANIVVLRPGATHALHIDLTQRRWWVVDTRHPGAAPLPLQKVTEAWSASFRLEYDPSSVAAWGNRPHAELLFPQAIQSRAFNAAQGVD